ncbi:hypothetical protein DERF_004825, partial [Dermatophagoides farinae]
MKFPFDSFIQNSLNGLTVFSTFHSLSLPMELKELNSGQWQCIEKAMDNDKLNGKKLASFLIEKRNDSVIAFRSKKKN